MSPGVYSFESVLKWVVLRNPGPGKSPHSVPRHDTELSVVRRYASRHKARTMASLLNTWEQTASTHEVSAAGW